MFEKLEGIIKDICQKWCVSLYDIDVINVKHGKMLCVYITKASGITITDCSNVSKDINLTLEADNSLLDKLLQIEVSSPGLERTLRFKKHYISSIDETLQVSYLTEEKKAVIIGVLKEVNGDSFVIENEESRINIPFSSVKKARTVYQNKNNKIRKETFKERLVSEKETE